MGIAEDQAALELINELLNRGVSQESHSGRYLQTDRLMLERQRDYLQRKLNAAQRGSTLRVVRYNPNWPG